MLHGLLSLTNTMHMQDIFVANGGNQHPSYLCFSDGVGGFEDGPDGPHKTYAMQMGLHTNGVIHGDVNGDDIAMHSELAN